MIICEHDDMCAWAFYVTLQAVWIYVASIGVMVGVGLGVMWCIYCVV